ncbi:ULP PROTEASE domain-containing protein, partial [Aphis craccivora]
PLSDDFLMKSVSTPGSHKSPFRLPVKSIDLYDNMLTKDLTYYKPIKLPKNKHYLVIFVCCHAFNLRLENTHILSCNDVAWLLGKRVVGEVHNKITFNQNSMVILPWLIGRHWIIVFINVNTKECYIMDPISPYDTESRESKDHFNKVFKILKSDVIYGDGIHECPSLTQILCPFENVSKQNDAFNCGVYIIYYAFKFMNNSKFSLEFDPNTYREYLKTYLLENSEDMTNICLSYCNWHSDRHHCPLDDEYVEWVSCSRCCRWIAINCIPKEYRLINYYNIDFFCLFYQK